MPFVCFHPKLFLTSEPAVPGVAYAASIDLKLLIEYFGFYSMCLVLFSIVLH